MAQYLVERRILINKPKNTILQLLGKPEDYTDVPENRLYYLIDLDYGYDINPIRVEVLVVQFGSNGHAAKAFRKIMLKK